MTLAASSTRRAQLSKVVTCRNASMEMPSPFQRHRTASSILPALRPTSITMKRANGKSDAHKGEERPREKAQSNGCLLWHEPHDAQEPKKPQHKEEAEQRETRAARALVAQEQVVHNGEAQKEQVQQEQRVPNYHLMIAASTLRDVFLELSLNNIAGKMSQSTP